MPAFVPVANGLQLALEFSSAGDTNENVFWVKRSTPWTLGAIQTMCGAFVTWFQTGDGTNSYKVQMSHDVSLVAIAARDHTTINSLSTVYQAGLPIVGGLAVPQIQLGCTKSFTARTGLAGKNYRGRMYAVGITTTSANPPDVGTVLSAYAESMRLALDSLPAAVAAADANSALVVCSRYYQPGGPGTPTVPRAAGVTTPITSYGYADLNVDFQRRRAPGHARHR